MTEYYDKHNKQIAYIAARATPAFWDRHWNTDGRDLDYIAKEVVAGKDDRFLLNTLKRYLPDKQGTVLEGGCGRGQMVYCMQHQGYDAIGVDFAEKTVARVKEAIPELDLRLGDVRALDFPADFFVGYWSLGVIEHFWGGYSEIASEMRRVLKKDGYLFLSFPYMSPLRKLKANLGLYDAMPLNVENRFFQFALAKEAVIRDFEKLGFVLLEKKSRSGINGLKAEIPMFRPLFITMQNYRHRFFIRALYDLLDGLLSVCGAGHVISLVFRKK